MQKLILSATLLLFCAISFAQNKKPYAVKTFTASEIKTLLVKTSGGSITVQNTTDATARVEMYVTTNNGGNNEAEINDRLANYLINITQTNSKLTAEAAPKTKGMNWKKGLNISFKVFSPKNIDTELNTSGGSINLTGLNGNLKFSTSGGSLSLNDLDGDITGGTSGGSITINDCHEKINLSTSGGSIKATNSTGTIKLNTSGGSLTLENLKGTIAATTSGGSISVKAVNGSLNTSTSGGSISLSEISGNVSANTSGGGISANIIAIDDHLTLNANGGNIKVDMPLNKGLNLDIEGNRISRGTLNNFSGEIEKDRIYGKLNGGGAKVRIHANSGIVSIN